MNEVNLNNNVLKCSLILRLDDIAPNMNWKMMNKVKNLFNKYNLKPIIGVIPNNEDIELKSYPECNFKFWDEIKNLQNQGWEIAMHGYRHLYSQIVQMIIWAMGGIQNLLMILLMHKLKK